VDTWVRGDKGNEFMIVNNICACVLFVRYLCVICAVHVCEVALSELSTEFEPSTITYNI
jgi:hypothetical protein